MFGKDWVSFPRVVGTVGFGRPGHTSTFASLIISNNITVTVNQIQYQHIFDPVVLTSPLPPADPGRMLGRFHLEGAGPVP